MLRRVRAFLVLGMSAVSIPVVAAAEEATDTVPSDNPTADAPESVQSAPATPRVTSTVAIPAPVTPSPAAEAKPEGRPGGWQFEVNGYFRAPMALGISSRPNPDEMGRLDPNDSTKKLPDGAPHTQLSYGPNRVMDWSY